MLCHQYPMLGVVDDSNIFHSYYVSPEHYSESVHAEILCSECHKGITKIPHEKGLTVDCLSACHLTEPTTGRPFSHAGTDEMVQKSVHGKDNPFARARVEENIPTCQRCHSNEQLALRIDAKGKEGVSIRMAKARCEECHQNRYEFVDRKLLHVMRRTNPNKNQTEIMDVCSDCHNDPEFNRAHDLVNAAFTYRENYHGKIMVLGEENAPSCLDCHIKLGDSPHVIKSVKDLSSATFPDNRGEMCTRADCHPNAGLGMGKAYIHVDVTDRANFPIEFWVMFFFTLLTIVSFVGLMLILIMELFRMIFPKFTFFKRRSK